MLTLDINTKPLHACAGCSSSLSIFLWFQIAAALEVPSSSAGVIVVKNTILLWNDVPLHFSAVPDFIPSWNLLPRAFVFLTTLWMRAVRTFSTYPWKWVILICSHCDLSYNIFKQYSKQKKPRWHPNNCIHWHATELYGLPILYLMQSFI